MIAWVVVLLLALAWAAWLRFVLWSADFPVTGPSGRWRSQPARAVL